MIILSFTFDMPNQNFDQYSDNQLKFGYWYTKNRIKIKATILSVLFLGLGILLIFNINSIVQYYTSNEINEIQAELSTRDVWETLNKDHYRPRPLVWQQVSVVHRGKDAYDLIVDVENPNVKWAVQDLVYSFKFSGWESDAQNSYIMPQQKRKLVYLNISAEDVKIVSQQELRAQVSVDRLNWQRVKDKKWFEDGNFVGSGLSVKDIDFDKLNDLTRELKFGIQNNSDFNYNTVEVIAVLYNGPRIVGVNSVQAAKLYAGENRSMSIRWFNEMPVATKQEVYLFTDIISDKNLLKFDINQFD